MEHDTLPYSPPDYLPRSAVALWGSIVRLVRNDSPCYLWLVTTPDNCHNSTFGERHARFLGRLRDYARDGIIRPNWGGVRVFEEHPTRTGHPLHSHLVLRGSMPFHVVQAAAKSVGLGNIWRRPKPVDLGAAGYLVKYLTKQDKPQHVRTWACVGTYTGFRKNDIEYDSPRIRRIKQAAEYLRLNGEHRYTAYLKAVAMVEMRETDWDRLGIKERNYDGLKATL